MLNARIRKRWRAGKFPIGLIGEHADLTYPYDYLGAGAESLGKLAGDDSDFAKAFKAAERPLVIVGAQRLRRARTARRSRPRPPRRRSTSAR